LRQILMTQPQRNEVSKYVGNEGIAFEAFIKNRFRITMIMSGNIIISMSGDKI